jgi:hypothetical protein
MPRHLQASQRQLGVLPAPSHGARDPPPTARDGVSAEFHINPPGPIRDLHDAATATLPATLYCPHHP